MGVKHHLLAVPVLVPCTCTMDGLHAPHRSRTAPEAANVRMINAEQAVTNARNVVKSLHFTDNGPR